MTFLVIKITVRLVDILNIHMFVMIFKYESVKNNQSINIIYIKTGKDDIRVLLTSLIHFKQSISINKFHILIKRLKSVGKKKGKKYLRLTKAFI